MFLGGCATRPLSFEYTRRDLLIPPGYKQGNLTLGKARLGSNRGNECAIRNETFDLAFRKSTAKLRADVGGTGDPNRVPMSTLTDISGFRGELLRLESNGCLRSGESATLLTRMIDALALPSRVAFQLKHGSSIDAGYTDVREPFRMKVVAPIRGTANRGFETAWYRVVSGRLVLERAESSVNGVVTILSEAVLARVEVPPESRHYRLFFLTRRTINEHDILLLSSASVTEMEENSRKLVANADVACKAIPSCYPVPPGSAVSAELPIKANGVTVYIPLSGTVNDA
ncbi:MAG: hypothetical protein HYZ37_11860, partial [Candidatus Solibacter usitatus]|nr:hypothetical protein [Candidatus Solibacter usitatus]